MLAAGRSHRGNERLYLKSVFSSMETACQSFKSYWCTRPSTRDGIKEDNCYHRYVLLYTYSYESKLNDRSHSQAATLVLVWKLSNLCFVLMRNTISCSADVTSTKRSKPLRPPRRRLSLKAQSNHFRWMLRVMNPSGGPTKKSLQSILELTVLSTMQVK
jgi:hypothetical protein